MDEAKLASDVRTILAASGTIREVKMFGGIGFMLNGNLLAAVSKRGLLLRIGKDRYEEALAKPGTRPMEMRGRRMEGYLYVDPKSLGRGALKAWLADASEFVRTLPPKPSAKKATPTKKRV